jgi:Xaa-Pro aminopeptidase
MINQEFIDRRDKLKSGVGSGFILLPGNNPLPMNYPSNTFPFRQDSTLLYFTGIDRPGIYVIIDCDSGEETLIGDDLTTEDIIWSGAGDTLSELANLAGIKKTGTSGELILKIRNGSRNKREVHYLPPYPADRKILLSQLFGKSISEIEEGISLKLIKEVIKLRSLKSKSEIAEIESALNIATSKMHDEAIKMAYPGKFEFEIVANICKIAIECKMSLAYPVICSVRGEILHNEYHGNKLKQGQLLLVDAGAESPHHYASDITRTIPVGGKFSSQQKEIYELVLRTQLDSINMLKPGIRFFDVHKSAAIAITKGLTEIGLMKGDTEAAVESGAHALFFPHGLGHMLGLDVHDMEDLGEEYVGYSKDIMRSSQFGTSHLRLARLLEPGFVITIEPGIYFIPDLIKQWQDENKCKEFINYNKLNSYLDFGGIRVEDNILITNESNQLLGKPIPKKHSEIENLFFT